MPGTSPRELLAGVVDRARLEYETRAGSLRAAREQLRQEGLVPTLVAAARRFAANNRTGVSLLSGRLSLGVLRPPGVH